MEFLLNHKYKICFNLGGKIITFTCEVIKDEENFVTFIDKFGKILTYNKSLIISVEEMGNGY